MRRSGYCCGYSLVSSLSKAVAGAGAIMRNVSVACIGTDNNSARLDSNSPEQHGRTLCVSVFSIYP